MWILQSETLTITDCPCTVTKPITTTSSVMCNTCSWSNATATTAHTTSAGAPTMSASSIPTAGAGKAAALSGAGLAGILGLAAFVL